MSEPRKTNYKEKPGDPDPTGKGKGPRQSQRSPYCNVSSIALIVILILNSLSFASSAGVSSKAAGRDCGLQRGGKKKPFSFSFSHPPVELDSGLG